MEIKRIIDLLEKIAPIETQEDWDCSGWQIHVNKDVKKIMLSLSVTENIVQQALEKNCDMIISHHPLFFIPFELNKNVPIYSAHTNLDKADGGTTDTLINHLELLNAQKIGEYLRVIKLEKSIRLDDFVLMLKIKLNIQSIRVVNNLNVHEISKIAFCAGSGSDFLDEAEKIGADVFVTGDVKYHTALESNVIIIDIGHFESELPVLKTIENAIDNLGIEVIFANEKSPFINY